MTALRRAITTRAPSDEAIELLLEEVTIADLALAATASVDAVVGDWGAFRSVATAAEPTTHHRLDGLAAMDFLLVLLPVNTGDVPKLLTVTVTAVEIAGTVRILSVERARPLGASAASDARVQRAPLGSEGNAIPVVDGTVNDFDRAVRLRGEGLLLMTDAGGSAHDPELFTRTVEGLDKDQIHAHTSDAVDASVETWSEMRSARLRAVRGTHRVSGSTITMEAVLEIVEADGTQEDSDVLITIHDAANPLSSPVIDLLERGRATFAEAALARRIRDIDLIVAREISDVTVGGLTHRWDQVDAVVIEPVADTFARTGLGPDGKGVSMLTVASFVFADGSSTRHHLTFVMDDPDAVLLTGRLTS